MIKLFFKKKTLRLFVFAAIILTTSNIASAQGGMFQRGDIDEKAQNKSSLLNVNREDNSLEGDITNQTFETPLGGELLILLSAGVGYALLKKNEED